jgi:hypothetical protein
MNCYYRAEEFQDGAVIPTAVSYAHIMPARISC